MSSASPQIGTKNFSRKLSSTKVKGTG